MLIYSDIAGSRLVIVTIREGKKYRFFEASFFALEQFYLDADESIWILKCNFLQVILWISVGLGTDVLRSQT